MDKSLLNGLLDHIEMQLKLNNKQEQVEDGKGSYQTNDYIDNVISETKELIKYNEVVIALENMLENLNEVSLCINDHARELIYDVFEGKIPERVEKLLKYNSLGKVRKRTDQLGYVEEF